MNRIPFEPVKKKKKASTESNLGSNLGSASVSDGAAATKQPQNKQPSKQVAKQAKTNSSSNLSKGKIAGAKPSPKAQGSSSDRIPKVVSDRMVRRAALFCGLPTSFGFSSLIASYVVISRHLFDLPNTLVLLVSLGLTGIGVLGLSYGALSASWDEDRTGTWWGGNEFQKNFSYLTAAWENQKQLEAKAEKGANKT